MQSIGPYRVLGEIARGGAGVVYRAHDPALDRPVAVKVLLNAGGTGQELERFQREARVTAYLRHPGIVAVHTAGVVRGKPYLVMDLIEGESLHARILRKGRMPAEQAARITELLARALAFAHSRGVLHRDIKPGNVLLDVDDEPLLTDFGIAKVLGRDTQVTLSGQVMGTPVYMPPEQARGDHERIGPHSDVYALGATLYKMLTGDPPFRGDSVVAILETVTTKQVVPPSQQVEDVDSELERLCLQCLEKDPARRPSAAALADALVQYRQPGESEPARRGWGLPVGIVVGVGIGVGIGGLVAAGLRGPPPVAARERAPAPDPHSAHPDPAPPEPAPAPAQPDRGPARRAARDLARLAVAMAEEGYYEQADAICTQALRVDSESVAAYTARGYARYAANNRPGALGDWRRAAELAPEGAGAFALRARLQAEARDAPKSLATLQRATRAHPRVSWVWMLRGLAQKQAGDLPGLEASIERAIALNPRFADALLTRAWYWLKRKEFKKAEADATRVIRLDPRKALAYHRRATARRSLGDIKGSAEDYLRAFDVAKPTAKTLVLRGWARNQLSNYAGALQDLNQAVRLDSRSPEALMTRAITLSYLKRWRESAADDLRALKLLPPGDPREQSVLQHLKGVRDKLQGK